MKTNIEVSGRGEELGIAVPVRFSGIRTIVITCALALLYAATYAQTQFSSSGSRKSVAVLGIDSKELMQDPGTLGRLAALRMQSHKDFSVMRDYDAHEVFKGRESQLINCYSVNCLTEIGKELGVQYMLSGSAERIGERIVVNLVLIEVASGKTVASDMHEYYNLANQMEGMFEISINSLLGREVDPMLVNALVQKEEIISEYVVERLHLSGPRMGVGYVGGVSGQRLMDKTSEGGFAMLPVMSQFGYQFEVQYLSAGNLQALLEVLPMVSGMDQGRFVPSITLLNGFRHSRSGFEFAFGPSFRLAQVAIGYYDNREGVGDGKWHVEQEWDQSTMGKNPNDVHGNLDSRGVYRSVYSFVFAVGQTFRSGHLNMPVNVYFSPGLHGFTTGISCGFNVRKRK